ncbi:toxin-antitoxin system YwqK family antitoxin [Candidatus Palauibacter sp.]|uniref:toxin-antitoxin system YwqK family antitoxin n=1 Tax=Candidatus Palauibacter sp. TaxID=3101350 RepID=UPI003B023107
MELADRPGCYIWRPVRFETVTWSGECAGGYAQGTGTQLLRVDSDGDAYYQSSEEGTLVDGRKRGRWAEEEEFRFRGRTNVQRSTSEGSYVNGERNGIWRHRDVQLDIVTEGQYVDGLRQGEWVSRHSSGTVTNQGRYVDGQQQGRWISRQTDGTPYEEGEYVDGRKHGFWTVFEEVDGLVWYSESRYVNGSKDGLQFEWFWSRYQDRAVQGRFVVGETSPITELECVRHYSGTLTASMTTRNPVAVTRIDLDEDRTTRSTCEDLLSKPKPEFGS